MNSELQQAKAFFPNWQWPPDDLDSAYQQAITHVEQQLWATQEQHWLQRYQRLCREMESRRKQPAHTIQIVIPVADRPRQLRTCLQSIMDASRTFGYRAVSVLVADDSRSGEVRRQHAQLAAEFSTAGLAVKHFDQPEQYELLQTVPGATALEGILGRNPKTAFYHKGPSVMRNLCYLWLRQQRSNHDRPLYLFIDSDQEFRLPFGQKQRLELALNHFYHIDRIFSQTSTRVLTGKVVGDPPVSPAVMAGTCLADVINFLDSLRDRNDQSACCFHQQAVVQGSYHDMAELFGLPVANSQPYACRLSGEHLLADCFTDFANRLDRFFDGEHPTRATHYDYTDALASLQPARTVYTGNFVLDETALEWFIPFAGLRLRMAGPVLGRLIQAEICNQFASANLPMLHKRAIDELGHSEFRPGVERDARKVDLSDEFERQFFGDLMLFSMEQLIRRGYPGKALDQSNVEAVLDQVYEDLKQRYADKQQQILQRLGQLQQLLNDASAWWQAPCYRSQRMAFQAFIDNLHDNFGRHARVFGLLADGDHYRRRKQAMSLALLTYPHIRRAWQGLLSQL